MSAPECAEPATAIFEVYSSTRTGGLHGELEAAVYCCDAHVEDYRRALLAAGLTPFRAAPPGIPRTCGQTFDYGDMTLTTWSQFAAALGGRS